MNAATGPESVRRAALLAHLDDLSQPPAFLSAPISTATRYTTDNLRIILFSPLFDEKNFAGDGEESESEAAHRFSHTGRWDEVQRLLTYVYVQATKVAQDMNRVLIDVDVLLKAPQESFDEELIRDAERTYRVVPSPPLPGEGDNRAGIVVLEPDHHPHPSHHPVVPIPQDPSLPPLYPVAALGGTFDHLHAGHKILLSMGAWIASEKLIVGVTDDALLKNKSNKEVLEPIDVRMARVRGFLELFKPDLQYDVVAISDVYGPTAWDPNVQALVVSKETLPGAASIHKHRAERTLPPLRTFVIDVISSSEASLDDGDAEALKKTKMSSTYIRQWIVQNRSKIDRT